MDHVERLLERWARWQQTAERHRLGYPTQSHVSRMMRLGSGASAERGPTPAFVDEASEWLDGLIVRLPERHRDVLVGYYIFECSTRDLAARLGTNRTQVDLALKLARATIAGALMVAPIG